MKEGVRLERVPAFKARFIFIHTYHLSKVWGLMSWTWLSLQLVYKREELSMPLAPTPHTDEQMLMKYWFILRQSKSEISASVAGLLPLGSLRLRIG